MTTTDTRQVPGIDEVDVAIVGGGFGGLCTALKLLEAGNSNFVLLEKAARVGGTWRENTYPGCACDVQSHLYSFSFEGNPNWSRRFASSHEIQRYIESVKEKHGLDRFIRYGRTVSETRFDEATNRWTVTTAEGTKVVARYVVVATGPLHVPSIPALPGLERFRGRVFHSARWDHDFDLNGKRVASIGTGASAIQYLPAIAKQVAQLDVYQRTAAWIVPRDERAYSSRTKTAFAAIPALRKLHRAQLYVENELRVIPMLNASFGRVAQALGEVHLRRQVRDPILRAKLRPDYTMGCKRVLISNDYYPMFARPNVDLVTDGIREIREHSIVAADGTERPVDAIVLGTGFVTDPRDYLRGSSCVGRDGVELRDAWAEGANAYYGLSVAGFPNLFHLVGPNTGLGHNSIVFMIEAQVRHVLACMELARREGADTIEVRPEVQRAFVDEVQRRMQGTVWSSGCRAWYQSADGRNYTLWPASTIRYWFETRRVDTKAYRLGRGVRARADAGARSRPDNADPSGRSRPAVNH